MADDYLMHYGRGHLDGGHSGRYPWGSGDDPNQRYSSFLDRDNDLKRQGFSEKERAEAFGVTMRELRAMRSQATNNVKSAQREQVLRYREQGMSAKAISEKMGLSESRVRNWLKQDTTQTVSAEKLEKTKDILRKEIAEKNYIDVGEGVDSIVGVNRSKLDTAVKALEEEGYIRKTIRIPQVSDYNKKTTLTVLAKPGTTIQELYDHRSEIGIVGEKVSNDGKNVYGLKPVKSISSKRVMIRYAEDGGKNMDGVIELRRGAEGLDLGNSRYAQVRIGVDGTHYLKGMAIYSDDLPKGVDIRFNTNKHRGTPMIDSDKGVLKPMKVTANGKIDQDNPFGSMIKPGGQRGYLNIVREEGEWDTWSRTLASQMLSKQSLQLAKQQLNISKQLANEEFHEINSLTNPTVRKHYLLDFADSCDSAAVRLKAAPLPRQTSQVILPLTSIKENQIYAPSYRNGEHVVLIRYPHGGQFEIPELVVNNNVREARRIFKGRAATDAVGIHPKVAERLSGADFDGDTVVVIPNNPRPNGSKPIQTKKALAGLKDFDPSSAYPGYKGMKVISEAAKQNQMGIVSNLITDMTLKGATDQELERAVKHSMVIIDAKKHKLDWRRSYSDQGIAELQRKYQSKPNGKTGASTIISQAKSPVDVPQRSVERYRIDPDTGEKIYRYTGRTKKNAKGEDILRTTRSTKMAEAKDARTLMSKNPVAMERVYADYANYMKAMGNAARKEAYHIQERDYHTAEAAQARRVYKNEIASLDAKIRLAKRNLPKERKAQAIANSIYQSKIRENPSILDDADSKKKVKQLALRRGREIVNKDEDTKIRPTAREWEAIQAGALGKNKQREILRFGDEDYIKKLAMPKQQTAMTPARIARAKAMANRGYTWDEIAKRLGVSASTVRKAVG